VIILDTGSSDKTLEIAHRLTDKVFAKEFSGDFSEMRNLAMSKAKNEWSLFLDADEFLYPEEINKLKKIISDGIDKNVGGVKFYA
jgi:Glycosyl transferase family 2.